MALQKRDDKSNIAGPLAEWRLFSGDTSEMLALVRDNLSGEQVGLNDLKRIRVPAGGGTIFTIPIRGKDEPAKQLDTIIIFSKIQRAYWPGAYAGKGKPPECSSDDAITGTKYGECANCQFSEFGSRIGTNGEPTRGQACKVMRHLYFLTPFTAVPIPYVLSVPPTSLQAFKSYLLDLASDELPVSHVVTRLELVSDNNNDGIAYSRIQPSLVAVVPDEQREAVDGARRMWQPLLVKIKAAQSFSDTTVGIGTEAVEANEEI